MKYTTTCPRVVKVDLDGREISIFGTIRKKKYMFMEKYYSSPDVFFMNQKTYHELLLDEAFKNLGYAAQSASEGFNLFGVKIKINSNLENRQILATSEPRYSRLHRNDDLIDSTSIMLLSMNAV